MGIACKFANLRCRLSTGAKGIERVNYTLRACLNGDNGWKYAADLWRPS